MKRIAMALALLAGPFVLALGAACEDAPFEERCINIPEGGCPHTGPSVCNDPTCQAVYACNPDETWTRESECPLHDAAVIDADAIARDATPPPLRDAAIDVPGANGGPGCGLLEPPDCPLGAVLACPTNACCGCEDLFTCTNGGWTAWGTCADGGSLTPH